MTGILDIGIVGCGIAGTSCALFLARQGHRVTLFEQSPQVGPVGAGVLLQPSGLRVLDELGLLQELLPKTERIERVHAVTETGRTLVNLRYADLSPELHGAGVHRGDLLGLLHGRLNAAGVRLLLGKRIVRIDAIASRPIVTDAAGQRYGPFDLLIAADGSRSGSREACGLRQHLINYAYGALWGVSDVAPVRGELFQAAHSTRQLAGLLPIGGGRCSLFWGVRHDRVDALRRRGFRRWREDVLRLMPVAEPLVDRISDLEAMRFVSYRHVCTPRFVRGRVVFIGDAAHSMSPHLGQGANLALLDARELSAAIASSRSPELAVQEYVRRRRRGTFFYGAVTAFLSPFFQGDNEILAWGRNAALPLMCRIPPVRMAMLRTLRGKVK
jgi:2-polyprenyl-6-methoxyphenol hydroxylase-like FAD-dependent oxidoreductase